MHLFLGNKVNLFQERSVVILRKRLHWNLQQETHNLHLLTAKDKFTQTELWIWTYLYDTKININLIYSFQFCVAIAILTHIFFFQSCVEIIIKNIYIIIFIIFFIFMQYLFSQCFSILGNICDIDVYGHFQFVKKLIVKVCKDFELQ